MINDNILLLKNYNLRLEDVKINQDNLYRKIHSNFVTDHGDDVSFHFEDILIDYREIYNIKPMCGTSIKCVEFSYNDYNFLIYCIKWCGKIQRPIDDNIIHDCNELFVVNLSNKEKCG